MKENIIFFTGAGISVDSGIPTFQEQTGIRDRLQRDFANTYPEEYRNTIKQMLDSCESAEPNLAHKAIADLGCKVVTMNVDRLHTKAGSKEVLEIHGVLPTREQLNEPDFPLTYSDIVLYGDLAPRYKDAIKLVKSLAYNNSYFIVVGTSFYTPISVLLVKYAKQRKAVIINIDSDASKRVPTLCNNLKDKVFK